MNSLYKDRAGLEKDSAELSPSNDYSVDQGVNIMLSGIQDKQNMHKELIKKNAMQNNDLIYSQQNMRESKKNADQFESMKAIQNQMNHYN